MNIQIRIRPSVAVLAIIAFGVSTAVIAANFSGSATADEPTTVELPVLQPVGYGGHAPDLDRDGDPGTSEVSPLQRTVTVPLGDDGHPEPERDFRSAVGALTGGPAPDASGFVFDIADGEDDPCAPEDDTETEGCPHGIRGAVFSLVAPDELWVRGSVPHAPSDELPHYAVQCEPVEHAQNALPFGFVSNSPGKVVMRYWPVGNAAEAVTVEARSAAADIAEWEAGLAASDTFEGEWTTINTCLVLDGLTRRQSYNYEFTLTDVLDRTFSSSRTFPFSLPDDRTAPPTRIQPLGRNAIMLSAPHRENVRVDFNVQVVDEGETADCSLTGDTLPAVQDEPRTVTDVSPEFLAANGYQSQYTKRTSMAVWVPEGSTIIGLHSRVRRGSPRLAMARGTAGRLGHCSDPRHRSPQSVGRLRRPLQLSRRRQRLHVGAMAQQPGLLRPLERPGRGRRRGACQRGQGMLRRPGASDHPGRRHHLDLGAV